MRKLMKYEKGSFEEVKGLCDEKGFTARIYHERPERNHYSFTKNMLTRRIKASGICDVLICKPDYSKNKLNVQFEIRLYIP